jgi:nucleoid DNA-binding protein
VRTPLGTFTAWPKAEKKIRLPDGREVSRKEEVVVRLRPGKALKRNK